MTVGYFLDLLIINAIRKEKLGEALEYDTELDLDKQDGFLLIEIGKTLLEIAAGKKPGTFSKHKNYDKTIAEITNNNLIEVIYKLYQRHSELWDLEDLRRDKNNSDKFRKNLLLMYVKDGVDYREGKSAKRQKIILDV